MNTELQTLEDQPIASTDIFSDDQLFDKMYKLAEMMASGKATVPKHLQSSPGDCFAVVMQSAQWQMNPYAVAQKTHLINGVLGYEAQLVNAVISSSKAIVGRFKYEYGGDWTKHSVKDSDCWIRVGAVLNGENDITWGEPLCPGNIAVKNSPLWKTAPKQQAAYLAVKYWARMYCPSVILGVYSPEELETVSPVDMGNVEVLDRKPKSSVQAAKEKARANTKQESKNPAEEAPIQQQGAEYPSQLAGVLKIIGKAKTKEEMVCITEVAEKLDKEEQEIARNAYSKKVKELKNTK